ncbi:hypothetical protein ACGFI3_44820 [Nonomuraea wenchangensis]|uniref:hypothetical protein n=1 Tax=Nonomuraea wenchangensis TaxID=568860 RepID=UPI0037150BC5
MRNTPANHSTPPPPCDLFAPIKPDRVAAIFERASDIEAAIRVPMTREPVDAGRIHSEIVTDTPLHRLPPPMAEHCIRYNHSWQPWLNCVEPTSATGMAEAHMPTRHPSRESVVLLPVDPNDPHI